MIFFSMMPSPLIGASSPHYQSVLCAALLERPALRQYHYSKAQQTDTVHVSSFDSVFAPLVQHSATGFIFDHIVLNVDPALIDGENAELMPLNASEFKQLLLKIQKVSF